jgi:hypothetical protein
MRTAMLCAFLHPPQIEMVGPAFRAKPERTVGIDDF